MSSDRPKPNLSKLLNDDLNEIAGGFDSQSYGFVVQLIIFILIAVLIYNMLLDELIYFYIEGCPFCIELDKKLEQSPLKLNIIKVNLKDNSKNSLQAKPLYYIGKYILGVKSAPTIYTKNYKQVQIR
jgi:hypothetical protein